MDRTRTRARTLAARILVPVAALAVASFLGNSWPRTQTVHYVLGDAAGRVAELDARWATDGDAAHDAWTREATFRYSAGQAPRVVTHEPRLADGNYTVQIDIRSEGGHGDTAGIATVTKHISLGGGVTDIELARSVPQ